MHSLISFIVVIGIILFYLIIYHHVDFKNVFDVMHTAFTRQFIFELIPFIILFSVREMKFIDISTASDFFNSIIGRSMIGMIAFTFVTYSLGAVLPHKIGEQHEIPHTSSHTFTSEISVKPTKKQYIDSYEKLLPYALI